MVGDGGGSATCVVDPMVEVTVDGRHATPGETAGGVECSDHACLSNGGTSTDRNGVEWLTGFGVGDHRRPSTLGLIGSYLAGDLSDDRAITTQLTWLVIQSGQSGQIGMNHHRSCPCRATIDTGQQFDGDISTQLVDGPGLMLGFQTAGQNVDVIPGGVNVIRRTLGDDQRRGALRVLLGDDLPLRRRQLIAALGLFGVGLDAQPTEPGKQTGQ